MKITIAENEKQFDEIAAWRIIGQILEKKNSVIGLSTGQTTTNMHRIVSELYELHPFDVSEAVFFNVDELTNLPRSYAGSCYAMIRTQLLDHLGVPDERFLMPLTESDDFEPYRDQSAGNTVWQRYLGVSHGRDFRGKGEKRDGSARRARAGRPDTGDQDDHAEQADYSGGKGSTQGGDYKTGPARTCD